MIVEVKGVSKRFGEVTALRGISFAIEEPQIVGVLGPNGAGKTTLLEILEGLSRPDEGSVSLFGEGIARYPKERVGVVMQREFVFAGITVFEYAELFSAIYNVRDGAKRIITHAKLAERQRTPVSKLSGGEQQRLFIAAATVHEPKILFLDEPSSALDPASKRALWSWLLEMKGCTIVLTTHDLREAEALCRSVLFLVGGEVKAFGEREALASQVPNGESLEDAFFHFCGARVDASGALA
jgi:ABC-2 type transport system ATP-binding protein